jgi:ketosteroid isomerase-like protein
MLLFDSAEAADPAATSTTSSNGVGDRLCRGKRLALRFRRISFDHPRHPQRQAFETGGRMTPRITMALMALALASPLTVAAQAGKDFRAEVEKQDKAWEKAYNAGDAAAVTALYAKDAVVMAPGAEPASGSAAIQKFFEADVKGGAKNTLTTEEGIGFGDYMVGRGKWVATSAEGKHLDHGQYLTLYKKEGGGWKILRDTWNSSMAHK